MTLETFAAIACAVLGIASLIGMKVSEKFVFVKFKDQKVGR